MQIPNFEEIKQEVDQIGAQIQYQPEDESKTLVDEGITSSEQFIPMLSPKSQDNLIEATVIYPE